MKPDWNDAPEWANYLARDSDEEWCWYENKPYAQHYYYEEGGHWVGANDGRIMYIECDDEWDKSLEERPHPHKQQQE